jgi:hypothetical protein
MRSVYIPNTVLSRTSTGVVSTTDLTANVTGKGLYYTVPDGEVVALPRIIRPKMKLYDGVATEMPRDTVWGFGFCNTLDPNRVTPIGEQMISYTTFLDLSLAEQGKDDYERITTFQICSRAPIIIFDQDETLCFLVWSASGTLDVSECTIEIPVYRGRAGDIARERAWRFAEIGR